MKKMFVLSAVTLVMAVLVTSHVLAQEKKDEAQGMGGGMRQKPAAEQTEMMGGMGMGPRRMRMMQQRMMGPGMMPGMIQPQVVPTEDGGVVVAMGNMLWKYDKEMQLVGKAKIEISQEDMREMAQKTEQCRRMCDQMMREAEQAQIKLEK